MVYEQYEFFLIGDSYFFTFKFANLSIKKAFNRYANLYRDKLKPNFPFSQKSVIEVGQNNPLRMIFRFPPLPYLYWKTIFEKLDNDELRLAQSKVRKTLLCCFIYMVGVFVIVTIRYALQG